MPGNDSPTQRRKPQPEMQVWDRDLQNLQLVVNQNGLLEPPASLLKGLLQMPVLLEGIHKGLYLRARGKVPKTPAY